MLTREQNIFLTQKVFVELVYNSAYIEGCNITFPQTQTIIEGAVVNGITVNDIRTVLNLKAAWKYCIENIDVMLNLAYICKINELVSRDESLQWGTLRTGRINVYNFIPPAPIKEEVTRRLKMMMSIADPVERAIEYFAYACKQQLFWDGNIRTSTIVANKMLIETGNGILTIGDRVAEEFHVTLNDWYLKDELKPLKDCLRKCIRTFEI